LAYRPGAGLTRPPATWTTRAMPGGFRARLGNGLDDRAAPPQEPGLGRPEATFEVGRLYLFAGPTRRWSAHVRRSHRADESREPELHRRHRFSRAAGRTPSPRSTSTGARSPSRIGWSRNTVRCTPRCGSWTSPGAAPPRPTPAALAYLRALDARQSSLASAARSAWYRQLVRYALDRISYDRLLANADTPASGLRSSFYQAMRFARRGPRATMPTPNGPKSSTPGWPRSSNSRWLALICAWVRPRSRRRWKAGKTI